MDLSKCTCERRQETDPAQHTETCAYRLAYDELVLQVPVTPEELQLLAMALAYIDKVFTEHPAHFAETKSKIMEYASAGQRMRVGQLDNIAVKGG